MSTPARPVSASQVSLGPPPQELLGRLYAELTARPDWEAGVNATVAANEALLSELTDSDPLVRLQAYL